MTTTFLYTLGDPRTGEVRYLGKSDNPFERLKNHWERRREKTHRGAWIRELERAGLRPAMELLDEVPHMEWQFWEREYIRVFRAIGVSLVNTTSGGDGSDSFRGRSHSPEAKEKIRRAALLQHATGKSGRGWSHSPEAKERIRQSRIGNKNPAFGKSHSPETRIKRSRALKESWTQRRLARNSNHATR